MHDHLAAALRALPPEATSGQVRDVAAAYYNRYHGRPVDAPVNDAELGTWLRHPERAFDLMWKPATLRHRPLYPTEALKVNWLIQAPCLLCPATDGSGSYPIQVVPWSRQSTGATLGDVVRQALLDGNGHDSGVPRHPHPHRLCVRVVFVLGHRQRLADADNLAKGLLDALQGTLYADDSQIDHLDVVRFRSATLHDGRVHVRHNRTDVATSEDVLLPATGIVMANRAVDLDIDRRLREHGRQS